MLRTAPKLLTLRVDEVLTTDTLNGPACDRTAQHLPAFCGKLLCHVAGQRWSKDIMAQNRHCMRHFGFFSLFPRKRADWYAASRARGKEKCFSQARSFELHGFIFRSPKRGVLFWANNGTCRRGLCSNRLRVRPR